MQCPKCQNENTGDRKFCYECGAKLVLICPKCQFENILSDKFCGDCGHDLTKTFVALPKELSFDENITKLEKYLPGGLTEKILSQRGKIEGERKQVTVLFADISGFTALSEKMDPEAVRDLMNRCFDRLVPCIQHFDGTIDKFIGDEIMALFGAPVAHENDPERALRAALEMQSALAKFNAENKKQLGIHFGINTGLVLAGGIGSSGQQEYSVMGDAVNLASRLEDVSESGQVLVGVDTYRLTEPLFEFETLSPMSVKGKSEPVEVYRLVGAKVGAVSARGLARQGLSSPLVGRNHEFETIKGCLMALSHGKGGVIWVIGEAGLGKSRLMVELRKGTPDVQWLEGKTMSFGQSISYFPFQEIVRTYAGISEDDVELEAWAKLESKIVGLFPDTALEILPYLATLLAVEVQGEYVERVKYLDGEALGKRLFLAMRRFVERLARTRPLVLVFEDLHWMDTSSTELLENILTLVREVPLLLIGISRPDPNTAGAHLREVCEEKYADCYTEFRLVPLSQSESEQLVNNLLIIDDLPARVRETMTQKSEGNPFFIEEIIRSLLDLGTIVRDPASGRWRATAQIETVHIPDTVHGVIMARIDRLNDDLKQALRIAAVIGRSFLYRILREVDAADGALDEHLTQLQQVELIREKQDTPELEYIFKHALAQEATYESILLQKRRELHGRVAESIEILFADRLEEFYSLLAYHFAKAENWTKAQEYLFKSGDQAGSMAADAEALTHYQQAMDAYARVFGDKWDPVQRAALERKIATALYRSGSTEDAIKHLEASLEFLGSPLPRTRQKRRLAILNEIIVQMAHFLFPRWFIVSLKRETAPAFEEEITVSEQLGWLAAFLSFEDALLPSLRILNKSERLGYARGVSGGLFGLGIGLVLAGQFRLAESYLSRSLKAAEFSGDLLVLGKASYGLQVLYCLWGNHDKSLLFSLAAVKNYREIGDLHGSATALHIVAVTYIYQGELAKAEKFIRELIGLGRELSDPVLLSQGLSTLGFPLRRLGRLEEAKQCLLECVELSTNIKNHYNAVSAGGELGRFYLSLGEVEKADQILASSEKIFRLYKPGWGAQIPLVLGLVELHLAKGDLKKGRLACREALQQCKRARIGLPDALRLRGTYEWLRNKPTAAQHWWQRSLVLAKKMGQRYDLGRAHLEIGQRLQDMEHLQKAESIFVEVGALPDLEKARAFQKELAKQ